MRIWPYLRGCLLRGCLLQGGVCSGGCLLRGCVSAPGVCVCSWGVCSRGVSAPGGVYSGGVSATRGVCLLWGVCSQGGVWYPSMHWGRHPHSPPCGQTDACKNITFATSLRTVITLAFGLVAKTISSTYIYFQFLPAKNGKRTH